MAADCKHLWRLKRNAQQNKVIIPVFNTSVQLQSLDASNAPEDCEPDVELLSIKEEEDEQQLSVEIDSPKFSFTAVHLKSEDDEEHLSSELHQHQMEEEAEEDCREEEPTQSPALNTCEDYSSSLETEDSEDDEEDNSGLKLKVLSDSGPNTESDDNNCEESRAPGSDVDQMIIKEAPEDWRLDVDQLEPGSLDIKEESEEVWTSLEGEQIYGKETDPTRFSFNVVTLKGEDKEERPLSKFPQHPKKVVILPISSSVDLVKVEADEEDCGGTETTWSPDLNTHENDSSSSETDVSEDDDGINPDSQMSKRLEGEERKRKYIENISMIMDGNTSDIEQLAEDEDEEWTPQDMHESSGGSDEEDNQEESVSRTSTDVEVPTTQDTSRKESVKDNAKRREYRWKKIQYQAPAVDFLGCSDEGTEDRCDWTPYMYFKQFVTEEMLREIAEQTNLYSVQKQGRSVNTSAKEMEQVLGMYLHMGLVQMSSVRAYWEMETKFPAVCDVMSRNRFQKLLTLIHFQDNLTVSDDANKDKVWKLRPWLQKLREQFLRIPPEECHAVDEIMVSFKGKSNLRVYMPAKPHKWGFKMWGRAGQSGFLYDFDVCQGAENPEREKSEVGVTGEVVLKMTSTLPAGKNHKVCADNYFSSVPLVQCLKERGIHYIGMIRMNRVKDCNMMDEKELKKKGRGSVDFRVNQDNNIIVRWYDNKQVNLISSFVGIEPEGDVKRWHRKSKTHIMVPRPAIVETYNKFMGGVELLDMLSALYKFSFRSQRWYMYIWWHTVTVAVINAWNLYRRDQNKLEPQEKPMALRRFQALVATSLTSAGKAKCGRPLSSPEVTPTPPRKRPRCNVPPDVRKDGIDHFPTWETRQRCKHCTGNHFSHVYCGKCKVHLCLNKERNCFSAYHNVK